MARRMHDARFATRYFVGSGIDVGAGNDSISQYGEFFPAMRGVRSWDLPDGDAQVLESIPDETFDFVHSSHCLEHMRDPAEALTNWFRVLKPCGHLICTVPDEDLYEQGLFPSTFNQDHKWTFTLWKARSWSPSSLNLFDLLKTLGEGAQVLKVELLDATFRFNLPRCDQTMTSVGESSVEFVIRKLPPHEIATCGRLPQAPAEPSSA
ncbi:conserved hypothetical protein [Ricinus communis]|uniref:Methyltransferase type 11 domain-containing protein n=1 Tax=Ricinus communis TaxID=3988 RepID=B9TK49_RICCO|nr:conserved hypothetical protein [Ricinus communis]